MLDAFAYLLGWTPSVAACLICNRSMYYLALEWDYVPVRERYWYTYISVCSVIYIFLNIHWHIDDMHTVIGAPLEILWSLIELGVFWGLYRAVNA